MRHSTLFLGVVATLGLSGLAVASPILAVDFNTATSNNQAGFQAFTVDGGTSGPRTQTFTGITEVSSGQIKVDLPMGAVNSRDRGEVTGSGPFNYSDLLRDLVVQISNGAALPAGQTSVSLQLGSLDPNTQYSIQLWSLNKNNNNGDVITWWATNNGNNSAVNLGTITNLSNPAPTSNNDFSITFTTTSDSSGVIRLAETAPTGDTGFVNGFTVSVVPEPGTLALLAFGSLAVLHRRSKGAAKK